MVIAAQSSAASAAPGISLRPYQVDQIAAVMQRLERDRSTLVSAATGCHRAGQLILMHDGSAQRVEDIVVGDQLMGPDGTPRTVLQLARGRQEMVEIRPTKGDPWVVNLDHVLSLVETNTGKPGREGGRIVDVTVREWLTWHRYAKHTHKLFRVGVEFPYRGPPRIDAYVLGVLLGDGSLKNGITVTAADREIWTACEPEAKRWGMRFVPLTPDDRCHGFRFSAETSTPNSNRMLKHLDALGLRVDASAKFIPDVYKFGLPLTRREVLAGLIDTDGHMRDGGFELTSKSKQLADDVVFVARSLGLAAYVKAKSVRYTYRGRTEARTFWRVSISGDCSTIPCRVFRKRAPVRVQRKDVLRTGFTVVPTGTVEDYYGFALDGDQRYLLGDFTVTHNTGKTIGIAELTRLNRVRGLRTLIVVNRDELVRQTVRKCEALGLSPDVEKGQQRASTLAKVVVASVQTLKGKRLLRWARDHFDLVIVDECHHAAAKSYRALIEHFIDAKVVGFTATAMRADGQPLIAPELFASIAHEYDIRTAIRDGNLVPITARRIVVDGLDLDKVDEARGDFRIEQLSGAMRDARTLRGQVVPLLELAHDRQTVAFCVDVQHAHDVAALLNDMRPGCARAVSGETDDDEREELLRAHAAGEFQFLTNCDLLVEGYDAPSISCVAMLRPTRSWGRLVQCVGRGLRLLGLTYAESLAAGKRDCLVLITDDGKTPGLQGPADVLLGFGAVADDLRAEIDRLIGTAAKPIAEVIEEASSEVEQRREMKQRTEVVRWHAEVVDPFIGVEPGPHAGQYKTPAWKREPVTANQLVKLEKLGVNIEKITTGKVRLSRAQAWDLLSRLISRNNADPRLCTLGQAKRLSFIDTRNLSFEDAQRLIVAGIKAQKNGGDWRETVRAELEAVRAEKSEAA